MMRVLAVAALLLSWSLIACGDDADPGTVGDGGGDPDAGVPGDGGGDSGDGPPAAATPLTERPSRGRYRCRLSGARKDHAPVSWGAYGDSALVVTGSPGTAYLARRETTFEPRSPGAVWKLVVGPLGADGTVGPPSAELGSGNEVTQVAAAREGAGFAVVWTDADRLRFARFDAAGKLLGEARDVASGVVEALRLGLAAGPDGGFGVVFDSLIGQGNQRGVFFMVLDGTGAVRAAQRRLDVPSQGIELTLPQPSIVGGSNGYAMLWNLTRDERGGVEFARADAGGVEVVARRLVSTFTADGTKVGRSAIFAPGRTALVEAPGGYVAAWVEGQVPGKPDTSTGRGSGAWIVVMLARLDTDGVRQGAPAPLRAPADSIDEVEPMLVPFADAIAVSWARGSHIYLCGGCVPDHRIDMMLVDPADLTPLSEVVTLDKDPAIRGGGLLRRDMVVAGSSLLTTFRHTFHVSNTPGSATFTCEP
jgi:hypothetical protein